MLLSLRAQLRDVSRRLALFHQRLTGFVAPRTPAAGVRMGWRTVLFECLLLTVAVLLYCTAFLGVGETRVLPGNEADVFQALDWVLVNSLTRYHQFPLWNPYLQAGVPYIADPMLHLYNPLVTLPVLVFGVWDGFKLGLAFSFVAAAIGMWRLGAVLGMSRASRLWMALMYAFAGQPSGRFMQGQYLFVLGFAWIPWCIGSLILATETRRRWHAAIAVLSLAMLFFSGNAYYTFYMLLVIVLFAAVTLLRFQARKPFVRLDLSRFKILAIVGVVALALVAVQLFPLVEFWPRMGKDLQLAGQQTPVQVFLDYVSKDTCRPDTCRPWLAREEFYAYIGYTPFLALILLPLAIARRDKRHLLFFALILALTVAWIDVERMPWRELFLRMKIMFQFRHLLRILAFGGFAVITLGGMSLDTLWKVLQRFVRPSDPARRSAVRSYIATVGLGILAGIMAYGVIDVFSTNRQHLQPQDRFQPIYEATHWLREYDRSEYYTSHFPSNAGHDAFMLANLRFFNMWYHFADIRQVSGMENRRPVQAQPHYVIQGADQPAPEQPDTSVVVQLGGDVIYRQAQSLPMAFAVADSELELGSSEAGELRREDVETLTPFFPGPNDAEVIASSNGDETLVLLITHYPGWRVFVDGQPHMPRNIGGYLATDLLPGIHQYAFRYRPASFFSGLAISLLSLSLTLCWLASDFPLTCPEAVARWKQARVRLCAAREKVAAKLRCAPGALLVTEAVYTKGIIHPTQPLTLPEDETIRLTVETGTDLSLPRAAIRRWLRASTGLLHSVIRAVPLDTALLLLSIGVYLTIRQVGLTRFPIYFFVDEANQTALAADLIRDGLRDQFHTFLPTYFYNVYQFSLSLSVYAQVLPYLLFGKSIFVTRTVAVLLTIPGATAISLILRDIFRVRFWWLGVFALSLTPAWFLHSRTAFETTMMASFFACFLYFYLLYRTRSPRYLYATLVCAALAFYSYSAGQPVLLGTALLILISDLRYHWQNRRTLAVGLVLAAILALPYVRFQIEHPGQIVEHLRQLNSYWLQDLPLQEKLATSAGNYLRGLNPAYWFIPNEADLPRHLMRGYGHISIWALPFASLGLVILLRRVREAPARAILAASLAAPLGMAVAGVGVTRALSFVVPMAVITSLGACALASWLVRRLRYALLAVVIFALLSLASFGMLRDALVNGPTWYTDYGMGGLQYGSHQIADAVLEILEAEPGRRISISPTWANGTDIVMSFLLPPSLPVQIQNASGFLQPGGGLTDQMLFILTPAEYEEALNDPGIEGLTVERTLPYPDGRPGFYFVHMHYSPRADEIFAQERLEQQRPVLTDVVVNGETIHIEHSLLDMGGIENIFDGDPHTLARGYEANPFRLVLGFDEPRPLTRIRLTTASMDFSLTVRLFASNTAEPVVYSESYRNLPGDPTAEMAFDDSPGSVVRIEMEIHNLNEGETAKIHLRELILE
jgi:hypothetical protein